MKRVFLYPLNQQAKGSPNPYMENFKSSLTQKAIVVNSAAPNRGVLNLYLFYFKTDIYILNWIEFVEEKKFGWLQAFLFRIFCTITRFSSKKIIWILHNKGSHLKKDKKDKHGGLFSVMMNVSDHIITHSQEGVRFVKKMYPFAVEKVSVFTHPILPPFSDGSHKEKEYDLLIWGALHPYKGVDLFLAHVKSTPSFNTFKILVIGKCFDEVYEKKLRENLSVNVQFFDRTFSLQEISQFASNSKFVLFTYQSETVISSGAFMDTLRMDTQIIGLSHAVFEDFQYLSNVHTYSQFMEIPDIINKYSFGDGLSFDLRQQLYLENSWDVFNDNILGVIKGGS
jgi:beta-1,4-mannosyltransferase